MTLGRSRPDLVGQDLAGKWHAFESKGRASVPSASDKAKAKTQAHRLISVGGRACRLHVGAFAFFRADVLEFYWQDPNPTEKGAIELPEPDAEWRYYYEPALAMSAKPASEAMAAERALADTTVSIHPAIRGLLEEGRWSRARKEAVERRQELLEGEYQVDGLKVIAGESWNKPYEARERR